MSCECDFSFLASFLCPFLHPFFKSYLKEKIDAKEKKAESGSFEKNYMKKDNFTTLDNRSSMSQCYTFVFIYHYHLRHCVVGKINDKDLM